MIQHPQASYWHTQKHPSSALDPKNIIDGNFDGSEKADIVVVGGGFTGLTAALNVKMQAPESNVILLESNTIGFGASGRNTGFVVPKIGLDYPTLKQLYGEGRTREAYQFADHAVEYVHQLIVEHRLSSEFRPCGYLEVACSKPRLKSLENKFNLLSSLGAESHATLLGATDAQALIKSNYFLSAIEYRNAGLLNPMSHAQSLANLCQNLGVKIYEHCPVSNIQLHSLVELQTPRGTVHADKIILSTNAYSHRLKGVAKLKKRQSPLWAYAIATAPLTAEQWQAIGWQERQGLQDNQNLLRAYRPTSDGRIVMTGGLPGVAWGNNMNRDAGPKTWLMLEKELKKLFPDLSNVAVEYRWGGPVSASLDMCPSIGYLNSKRIVYSAGCFGHGVASSHLLGKTMADLCLSRQTELTDLWFVQRKPVSWLGEPFDYLIKKSLIGLMKAEDTVKMR